MKISRIISFLILVLFVSSCSDNTTSDLLITFDDATGYVQNQSITTTQAHSGKVSILTDPDHIYGLCYKAPFSLIAPSGVTTVHVSGWVLTESVQSGGNIVVGVDSADQNILWNAIDAKSFGPEPGKWTEINGSFDIKKVNKPSNIFVLYPMSTGKGKIWFDDLSVRFE